LAKAREISIHPSGLNADQLPPSYQTLDLVLLSDVLELGFSFRSGLFSWPGYSRNDRPPLDAYLMVAFVRIFCRSLSRTSLSPRGISAAAPGFFVVWQT
jgi:hypothetical protein